MDGLEVCAGKSQVVNKEIANSLSNIGIIYKLHGDYFRQRTYSNTIISCHN
jgi:hypothetical protein